MGEIATGHDARTEFPQIQWPTLCGNTQGYGTPVWVSHKG